MRQRGPLFRGLVAALCAVMLTYGRYSLALGPFERNHPLVEEGMRAYAAGHYEDALKAFDAASEQLPGSQAVELDRGNALYQLGRYEEAKQIFSRLAQTAQGDLKAEAYYNLGNTNAKLNQHKDAISAYRRALSLNPQDDRARRNLEIVLRNLPPPQQQPDGGTPDGGDGGRPDAGQDGGRDGGGDGGSHGDGGSEGGSQKQDGGDGGSDRNQGQQQEGSMDGGQDAGQPNEGSDGGMEEGEEVDAGTGDNDFSKHDAEKLLDSMKQNEKNLQLWRFQQKKPRKPSEKDW